ncbi:MAG: HAMP domain-containing histidine kinase [Clostridiales Family XIII bacterium]|nr:HAMP domain-containing histidine kinase [Clostridiales Family XIII bacterium]
MRALVFVLCVACFVYGAFMASKAVRDLDESNYPLLETTDPRLVLSQGNWTSNFFAQQVNGDVLELYNLLDDSWEAADDFLRNAYEGLASVVGSDYVSDAYTLSWGGYGNMSDQSFAAAPFLASDAFTVTEAWDEAGGIQAGTRVRSWDEEGVQEAFRALYPEQVAAVEAAAAVIEQQELQAFESRLGEGVWYFATNGDAVLTNVPKLENNTALDTDALEVLEALDASSWYALSNNGGKTEVLVGGALSDVNMDFVIFPYFDRDARNYLEPVREGTALFVAYPAGYIEAHEAALASVKDAYRTVALPVAVAWLACIVLTIMLLVFIGRKRQPATPVIPATNAIPGESGVAYRWDRCPMEVQIILILVCFVAACLSMVHYTYARMETSAAYDPYYLYYWPEGTFGDVLFCAAMAGAFALGLWCLTSLVRNGRAGTFARRSGVCLAATALGRGVAALARAIKSGFDGTNPLAKTLVLVGAFWLATAILAGKYGELYYRNSVAEMPSYDTSGLFILILAVLILALWFTLRWVQRFARLKEGIEEVSKGNVDFQIEVPEGSTAEFDVLSRHVNEIGAAIGKAVESELKQQRLKTDLISNVSHDLKTPLTSILTYTDLLKKEGLRSKHAGEYLAVIDAKGQRLKKLTVDLFEAAKASSGALPVRQERVDLAVLVRQALAEAEEGLAAAGLEVIVNEPDGEFHVVADGNLLWRVLDNLFGNVRKYALEGSRVYVDLENDRMQVVLAIKNISAVRLNIAAEELMERFTRGDENRSTEGSGLGLAIARDLVRLMGGSFDIVVDGDLFKAVIAFPQEEGVS